jgi:hypothetical protein
MVKFINVLKEPAASIMRINFTLKREAAESSDTLVYINQTTRPHINNDRKLNIHLRQSPIGLQLYLPYDEKTNDR